MGSETLYPNKECVKINRYWISDQQTARRFKLSQNIKIEPAHCVNPGVTVTENGVIVSAVFRGKEPCGLILYNRADKSEITVQFTDEHRFGSLYSVQITPIDPDEWCYRLFSGSTFFVDPCCRSIVQIESEGRTIRAGGFFHRPDDKLPAYHGALAAEEEERPSYTAFTSAVLQCLIKMSARSRALLPPPPRKPDI